MTELISIQEQNRPTWVIKIGGSLLGSSALSKWLQTIVDYGRGNVIIVPGGGVFADAVREAQIRSGVDDVAAHQLALHAMDQYGRLMAAMNKQLVTVNTPSAIAATAERQRAMVWLPSQMLLADNTLANHWQNTSDSLSVWLAKYLKAAHLVIVKSASLEKYQSQSHVMVEALMNDALVDSEMARSLTDQAFKAWLVHKHDHTVFARGFEVAVVEQNGLLMQSNTH